MKIVKEGKIPSFAGKCILCGCEVEAEYREFVSDGYGNRMIVACPTKECGRSISLSPKRSKSPNQYQYKVDQLVGDKIAEDEEDFGDQEA